MLCSEKDKFIASSSAPRMSAHRLKARLNRHSTHPYHGCGKAEEGEEVAGAAIIAGGESAKMLQFVEAALDAVALAIERCVERNEHLAAAARGDHGFHPGRRDVLANGVAVVGLVGNDGVAGGAVQQRRGRAAVVHLAAGQQEAQRPPERVGNEMDFGRQSASGTPQSLVRAPFLAPPLPVAACWCALTRVASSIRYAFLRSFVSSAKIRSQTPAFAQREKRLWTLFHLPYRSGSSSHCAPDLSTQSTPLTNRRLSFAVRPGSDFLPGNISAIRAHCWSLSSYRFAMRCAPNQLIPSAMNQSRFPLGILNV